MAFWKKFYKSKYTGAEIDAAVAKAGDATKVTANPTLAGTEAALTGLEVGETKYKVEQPINVVANPTLAGTEASLTSVEIGNTKYRIGARPYELFVSLSNTSDPDKSVEITYSVLIADGYTLTSSDVASIVQNNGYQSTADYRVLNSGGAYFVSSNVAGLVIATTLQAITAYVAILDFTGVITIETFANLNFSTLPANF